MNVIFKYKTHFLCLLSFSTLIIYYSSLKKNDFNENKLKFQSKYTELEYKIDELLDSASSLIYKNQIGKISKLKIPKLFFYHVYRNDSLVLWNTNQVSVSRFVDIHFPYNGLLKLQNGWYYSKAEKVNKHIVAFTFLIKHEFEFKNEFLDNQFNPDLNFKNVDNITLDKNIGYPIYNKRNNFQFSLVSNKHNKISTSESNFLLVLWLLTIIFYCTLLVKLNTKKAFISLILSLFLVLFLTKTESFESFKHGLYFFDPKIYAKSLFLSDLFSYLTIIVFGSFILKAISKVEIKKNQNNSYLLVTIFFLFLNLTFYSFLFLSETIFIDSSIQLSFQNILKLDLNTFLIILILTFFFVEYYKTSFSIFRQFFNDLKWFVTVVLFIFISFFIFFIWDKYVLNLSEFNYFLIIILFIFLCIDSKGKTSSFNLFLFKTVVFTVFITYNFYNFLEKKELSNSEIYASQILDDKDISTEIEFDKISNKLSVFYMFEKLNSPIKAISKNELKESLDKAFFNDFWDRFEVDYVLFDKRRNDLIATTNENLGVDYLLQIINSHSIPSELNNNLFYIKDFSSQLNYISKTNITIDDKLSNYQLLCVFKSKRIPEKIGFPRLLVTDNTNVLSVIEKYSFAKYYNGKLINNYGDFSYPLNYKALKKNSYKKRHYFFYKDFKHYKVSKNNETLILSSPNTSVLNLFSTFSYLYFFHIFFLLIHFILINYKKVFIKNISLAFKIQLAFILLILFSLIVFSYSAGFFVKDQYDEFSTKQIVQKLISIKEAFNFHNSNQNFLSTEMHGEKLNSECSKLSFIFDTDVSLFDINGYLIASSRNKIFDLGLISEQMNAKALSNLKNNKLSEYVQNENIGNLFFLAAYSPVFNQNGNIIAYVNLQYFRKKNELQEKIESLVESILNIFVLLLVLSLIVTYFVSNWLTKPLKIIQESLLNVELGKFNEPIPYQSNDEIGELVKNYNQKLNELAITANQLAISEREYAWREMAKQVAHEIKNPLTPMKLSLQHFQRAYDLSDPNFVEKLNKIILSLIEQIDSLTKIANEFSNFAKLPQEKLENIDLIPILKNITTLYQNNERVNIFLNFQKESLEIKGDKNLLLQVFNNIILNAIQANEKKDNLNIFIEVYENENQVFIEINDNGIGISDEVKDKIFQPNFTTKSTGSGFGLALSKQIIKSHEGDITFQSIQNKFTKFIISLPIKH